MTFCMLASGSDVRFLTPTIVTDNQGKLCESGMSPLFFASFALLSRSAIAQINSGVISYWATTKGSGEFTVPYLECRKYTVSFMANITNAFNQVILAGEGQSAATYRNTFDSRQMILEMRVKF